jgi:hypothetical protein
VWPGQGGANGDSDIDGLDGGTRLCRKLFNANELDHRRAIWDGVTRYRSLDYITYDSHTRSSGFYYRLNFGVTISNHISRLC